MDFTEPTAAEKGSARKEEMNYPHIEQIEYSTLFHASLGCMQG
jgi:hypothetical protein